MVRNDPNNSKKLDDLEETKETGFEKIASLTLQMTNNREWWGKIGYMTLRRNGR